MPEQRLFKSLSVVIPTYNRERVLAKALEGYLLQSSPRLIDEMLVVDDGSTDNTELLVQDFSKRSAFPVRYLRQCNKGPAAARNLGIREARSDLLLFSDSDVIPKCDLVEQHIEWHQHNPQMTAAVLGYVTWDPAVHATPFMRWYGEDKLFAFSELRNRRNVDFRSFYTCNLSLKTEFIRTRGQFDEAFKTAAYEDTELGYRLCQQGLRLLYNSKAIGYHHQFFSFEDACRKAEANAGATQLFFETEAGRTAVNEIQRKQALLGYRLAKRLAGLVVTALTPVRHLLDSSVPLPGMVYRLFFWASTRETMDQVVGTPSGNETRQGTMC